MSNLPLKNYKRCFLNTCIAKFLTDNFRLQIQATAQGTISQQTATAFVNVTVIRNANPPIFSSDQYSQVIQDTLPVGSSILTITANDLDLDTIRYTVIDTAVSQDYFYLNPFTGVISLSRSVYNVGENQYQFTVQASDQRINERTDTAEVFITILRDQSPPQFTNEPYQGTVREIDVNGTSVTTTTCFDPDRRGNIVYAPVAYSVATAFFGINSATGNIFLYDSVALRLHNSNTYVVSITFITCKI